MTILPIKQTDIVFLGDSLTESFDLEKHFKRNDLRNRGMGGNMTDHVLYRLEEITNAKPSKVFLMIGINDLYQGHQSDEILGNIIRILNIIHKRSPQTTRYLQSILPVNEDKLLSGEDINVNVYQMNNHLEKYCQNNSDLTFINLHNDFLNLCGQMSSQYTVDGVHLTTNGYELWANLIREYLDQ